MIDEKLYSRLGIAEAFAPLIVNSWEREDLSLYGRFDLFYDGKHQPKMSEYNADTRRLYLRRVPCSGSGWRNALREPISSTQCMRN